MAAELIMPTAPGDRQSPNYPPTNAQQFAPSPAGPRRPSHARSQSYQVPPPLKQLSPLSTSSFEGTQYTASTPASPDSSHHHHLPRNRPAYRPAVLRPNKEFMDNTLIRSSTTGHDVPGSAGIRRLSGAGFLGLPGLAEIGHRLSRRSTSEDTKSFDGDWDLRMFPQVTDVPTRSHWKPDPESSICDDPACKRTFNYFIRRHHCRRCGNIFCDWHSNYEVPLDQDANFNPRADPSRTCNHCFNQLKTWHSRNNSQSSSSASSVAMPTAPPTPIAPVAGTSLGLSKSPDVAASVPRNWNWSTF